MKMKYSEAMLKGFEMVDGRQCKYLLGDSFTKPTRVCVNGAVNLAVRGDPYKWAAGSNRASERFEKAWGIRPAFANNEGLHWTEIYGMAVAAGL